MRSLLVLMLPLLVACEGLMILDSNGNPRLLSGYAVVEEDAFNSVKNVTDGIQHTMMGGNHEGLDSDGYRERLYIPQSMSDNFALSRTETSDGEWMVEVTTSAGEGNKIGFWSNVISFIGGAISAMIVAP